MGEEAVMNSVGNAGHSWPLAPPSLTVASNFSVYSKHATSESNCSYLIVLTMPGQCVPSRSIPQPTGHITTGTSSYPACKLGQHLRLSRSRSVSILPSGMRFDPTKVLLDPYGRGAVVPKRLTVRDAARKERR